MYNYKDPRHWFTLYYPKLAWVALTALNYLYIRNFLNNFFEYHQILLFCLYYLNLQPY